VVVYFFYAFRQALLAFFFSKSFTLKKEGKKEKAPNNLN
jgi:hypothetical protein